MKADNIYR